MGWVLDLPTTVGTTGGEQVPRRETRPDRSVERVEPVEVDRLDQAVLATELRVDAGRGAPRELGDVAHGERRRPLALQHLERRGHESITHRAGRLG